MESASEGARRKPRRLCFQYAGPEGTRRRAIRDQRHLRALPRIRLRAQALPHPEQHLRRGHPARRHPNRQAPLLHLPGHPTTDRSDNHGIKTGYNKAFITDDATKEALVAVDPNSADIIKPVLRGRDIQRYRAKWAGLWLIYVRRGLTIDRYPVVYKHLSQHRRHCRRRPVKTNGTNCKPAQVT